MKDRPSFYLKGEDLGGGRITGRYLIMDINRAKLGKDLAKIVGKEHVFTDRATSVVYAKDPMP